MTQELLGGDVDVSLTDPPFLSASKVFRVIVVIVVVVVVTTRRSLVPRLCFESMKS